MVDREARERLAELVRHLVAGTIRTGKFEVLAQDRLHARWEEEMRRVGDYDVWPFRWHADFDEARRHPRLLHGN